MVRIEVFVSLCLVAWWNNSVVVDGHIPKGCQLAYLPYKGNDCIMSLQFKGSLPSWFRQEDIATEITRVEYSLLKHFAKNQVCPCEPPELTRSCPEELREARTRLLSPCPLSTQTVEY